MSEITLAFDLDGTLTNGSEVSEEIINKLNELSRTHKIAIVSGSPIERIEKLLKPAMAENPASWIIFSNTGGEIYAVNENTKHLDQIYQSIFHKEIKNRLITSIKVFIAQANNELFKNIGIEDRETLLSVVFAPRSASDLEKSQCDADRKRRQLFVQRFSEYLQEKDKEVFKYINSTITGRTTVDILPNVIDKAFAIETLAELLEIDRDQILFLGNEFEPWGNDFPVTRTGCAYWPVISSEDTSNILNYMITVEQ